MAILLEKADGVVARVPGRVTIMGDHTDYNDGLALAMTTKAATVVTVAAAEHEDLLISSEEFAASVRTSADAELSGWPRYVVACMRALRDTGIDVSGLRIDVGSGVPMGRGMSSSTALTIGVLAAVAALRDVGLENGALAALSQRVENEYLGIPSGSLDQKTIIGAEPHRALLIDFASDVTRLVPIPTPLHLWVLDSGVERNLGPSNIGRRRAESEAAARALPAPLRTLSEVDDLEQLRHLDALCARRARHVFTENARVRSMVDAFASDDLERVGRLFSESHASSRDDYEVSLPVIDRLCERVEAMDGVLGARIVGAGFGGGILVAAAAPPTELDARLGTVWPVI